VPVNLAFVEGARAFGGTAAYTRSDALRLFREAASVAAKPFIYLSAGVSDTVFQETLELAAEAGTSFSGVLCGRAGWQGGVPAFAKGGREALSAWLANQGVRDIMARNAILAGWSQDLVDSVRWEREYRDRCSQRRRRRVNRASGRGWPSSIRATTFVATPCRTTCSRDKRCDR
jgi:hypothetical protein